MISRKGQCSTGMKFADTIRRIAPRFQPLAIVLALRADALRQIRRARSIVRHLLVPLVTPPDRFAVRRFVRSSAVWARRKNYTCAVLYPPCTVTVADPIEQETAIPRAYRVPSPVRVGAAGVMIIPGGHLIGRDGAVVDPDGTLLWDVSPVFNEQPRGHPCLARPVAGPARHISGAVATIAAAAGNHNMYHFLLEVVPRLHLLERAGYTPDTCTAIVTNGDAAPFVEQVFRELALPPDLLLETSEDFHITADQLIVPTLPRAYIRGDWVYQYIRRRLGIHRPQGLPSPRRVHISRARGVMRRVRSGRAYQEALSQFGFVPVYLEEHPVHHQRAIVAGAEVVIGEHGAGLTHVVFCRPGTLVVEILSGAWPYPHYSALSSQCGLPYAAFFGYPGRKTIRATRRGIRCDYSVDRAALARFLTELGL